MKTAIIYYSKHHENTKQLLDAIAAANQNQITFIAAENPTTTDLSSYDLIGFASGIYYGKFHDAVLDFAQKYLPIEKKVFFIYTCGSNREKYTNAIRQITDKKNCSLLGVYSCLGFDTFGPFKFIGGIAKGHPNTEEIAGAVSFLQKIPL